MRFNVLQVAAAVAILSGSVTEALPFGLKWPSVFNRRATVCNGRAELCNRSYGNTTFLGAHNSFGYSSNPFALARNQEVDVPAQWKAGARMFQGQTHMKDGKLNLCHSTCGLFDGGTLENYLKRIKTLMDANPNEVVTLILTNPERVSLTGFWKPAFDNSGLTPLAYVPPADPMKRNEWPTLGQLIDSGKKLIVFMDEGADGSVNFLLPQFEMMWENPFSVTDENFPCSIDRVSGPLSNDDHMHLINHVLNINVIPIGEGVLISDRFNAGETNGLASILEDANGCTRFSLGRAPNFVLLDWVNVGQGKQAVDRLNGF